MLVIREKKMSEKHYKTEEKQASVFTITLFKKGMDKRSLVWGQSQKL